MCENDSIEKEYAKTRIVGYALLLGMPVMYLFVATVMNRAVETGGHIDMMFYILLIIATVSPAAAVLIQRVQVQSYCKGSNSKMNLGQLFFVTVLIKMVFAEAAYLYGLVVYLVSGDFEWMLAFYPIGLAWTAAYWPTRNRFETFIAGVKQL